MREPVGARAILGAIVCALTLAAPAGAQFNRVAAAKAVANRVWRSPCNGQVTTRRGVLDASVAANAYYSLGQPGQPYTDCVVTFNAVLYAHGRANYQAFCSTLLHEWGHLAGYRAPPGQEAIRADGTLDPFHSRDPRSVMFPILDLDPRCTHPGTSPRAGPAGAVPPLLP